MYQVGIIESASDIQKFHQIAEEIYAGDPNYIQPLTTDIEDVFNPALNPAFETGKAVRILLSDGKRTAGRAAVFYTTKGDSHRMGGIGFFECINNQEAANAIFDWSVQWLRENDCSYMDGPVNFGDRDSFWGLLVENHSYPSYRENYQPSYYRNLFENYGFERIIEQSTSEITEDKFNFERFSKLAERVMQNSKYHFETLDFGQVNRFAQDFTRIYNEAWAHHEDFKPMTVEAVLKRLKQIKPVIDPAFAIFAYAEGRPIGFYISMLEVNQLFRRYHGKLTLWNKIHFMLNRSKINKVRGIIFGVVPDYQNLGIETGMIMKFRESYQKAGRINAAELAWIGDFNPKMLSMLRSLGAYTTKIHYTYRKKFS